MRKYILLLICICSFLASTSQAKEYEVKDIVMVHLQDKTRFVCNPDGIFSEGSVAKMDSILYALEQKTGIETVVVAVKQIAGHDCFEFAYQIGKQYGVGKKKTNNGLVILLVTDERCIQFATGYGIEGTLPDAICKRIQIREMNPYFKDGKWDEGMLSGIRSVYGYLDGSMQYEPENNPNDSDGMGVILVAVFGFFGIGLIVYIIEYRKSRCPKCKKHTMKRTESKLISNRNGIRKESVIYTCSHCGYTETREETSENDDYDGGIGRRGGGPFIFGGGGGFGSGGGGFSGGSFGGGSFGGGGSGSRF